MSLYVIGDLHLSEGGNKKMNIFDGWDDYVERIQTNWLSTIQENDDVLLAGDFSWGMSLEEALPDFQFVEKLPGRKIMIKGNHDYWWGTVSKMNRFLSENGIKTFEFLHNNSVETEQFVLCGCRGWILEQGDPFDQKVLNREVGRLRASLQSVGKTSKEIIAFLHYPPILGNQRIEPLIDLMKEYKVHRCFYGHLHGTSTAYAFEGDDEGIEYRLISSDYLRFQPYLIQD